MTDARKTELELWLKTLKIEGLGPLCSLNGDASFRRYFRVGGYIAVDAPPATQKNAEFVDISRRLREVGLRVPHIFACDLEKGFMLIEDLGSLLFASRALGSELPRFYDKAAALLPELVMADNKGLPPFDRDFILMELHICSEWYLTKKLGLTLTVAEQALLDKSFNRLADLITAQPQAAMHRDFHCRNLMVLPDESLAVIDYQDMVRGPVTYDLASLLFDCYRVLPQDIVDRLTEITWRRFAALGLLSCSSRQNAEPLTLSKFRTMLKVVSLQRHIKVLGIFCRLSLRDGKDGYLTDLPRVFDYVLSECAALPEFNALGEFFKQRASLASLSAHSSIISSQKQEGGQ